MTWLTVHSFREMDGVFDTTKTLKTTVPARPLMTHGSLFFEFDVPDVLSDQTILELNCEWENHFNQCRIVIEGGAICVQTRLGGAEDYIDPLEIPTEIVGRKAFVTLAWDIVSQEGYLALESVAGSVVRKNVFVARLPFASAMVEALGMGDAVTSYDVSWAAISDEVEPICAFPKIGEGAKILTPSGYVDIASLRLGDLVTTKDNGPQPIRWITERCLPVVGALRPKRIFAPLYDVKQELTLGANQRILFEREDMEYVLGCRSGLARVADITSSSYLVDVKDCATIWYYGLLFDDHEVIDVNGCFCESEYLGGLLRYKAFLPQTLYAGMPLSSLPRHRKRARQTLTRYELADIA